MDVLDDHQERFLAAYERIRNQVADVPGHISDQLCQSLGNSSQWLITSEWQSSEHFLAWVDSPAHREMVAPMSACLGSKNSLRYVIMRETPDPLTGRPESSSGAASRRRPAMAADAPQYRPAARSAPGQWRDRPARAHLLGQSPAASRPWPRSWPTTVRRGRRSMPPRGSAAPRCSCAATGWYGSSR